MLFACFFFLFVAFDCSCFNGEYVTGEKIGDAYFTKLFDLRNDDAKQLRNNGAVTKNPKDLRPQASNSGCESVTNDMRKSISKDDMCEAIVNETS